MKRRGFLLAAATAFVPVPKVPAPLAPSALCLVEWYWFPGPLDEERRKRIEDYLKARWGL